MLHLLAYANLSLRDFSSVVSNSSAYEMQRCSTVQPFCASRQHLSATQWSVVLYVVIGVHTVSQKQDTIA